LQGTVITRQRHYKLQDLATGVSGVITTTALFATTYPAVKLRFPLDALGVHKQLAVLRRRRRCRLLFALVEAS
jgi:hypothetical protein